MLLIPYKEPEQTRFSILFQTPREEPLHHNESKLLEMQQRAEINSFADQPINVINIAGKGRLPAEEGGEERVRSWRDLPCGIGAIEELYDARTATDADADGGRRCEEENATADRRSVRNPNDRKEENPLPAICIRRKTTFPISKNKGRTDRQTDKSDQSIGKNSRLARNECRT